MANDLFQKYSCPGCAKPPDVVDANTLVPYRYIRLKIRLDFLKEKNPTLGHMQIYLLDFFHVK